MNKNCSQSLIPPEVLSGEQYSRVLRLLEQEAQYLDEQRDHPVAEVMYHRVSGALQKFERSGRYEHALECLQVRG